MENNVHDPAPSDESDDTAAEGKQHVNPRYGRLKLESQTESEIGHEPKDRAPKNNISHPTITKNPFSVIKPQVGKG
jgi:hypothetical protein